MSANWREKRAMSTPKLMAMCISLRSEQAEEIKRLRQNVSSLTKKNHRLLNQIHHLERTIKVCPPPRIPHETRPESVEVQDEDSRSTTSTENTSMRSDYSNHGNDNDGDNDMLDDNEYYRKDIEFPSSPRMDIDTPPLPPQATPTPPLPPQPTPPPPPLPPLPPPRIPSPPPPATTQPVPPSKAHTHTPPHLIGKSFRDMTPEERIEIQRAYRDARALSPPDHSPPEWSETPIHSPPTRSPKKTIEMVHIPEDNYRARKIKDETEE